MFNFSRVMPVTPNTQDHLGKNQMQQDVRVENEKMKCSICNAPSRPDANASVEGGNRKQICRVQVNQDRPHHTMSSQRKCLETEAETDQLQSMVYQTHSHSQNTHQRATRSARTRPRQVPRSPILITVSHMLPSAAASVTLSLGLSAATI